MNREIKFGAWDKRLKVMIQSNNLYRLSQKEDGIFAVEGSIDRQPITTFHKDLILMQFTGLLDKNGKEGYHKNITEDKDGDRYLVEWDNERGVLYLKGIGIGCLGVYIDDLELVAIKEQTIIGNATENPELLKESK